ncbi:hypothetical protein Nans01_24990 [Nocardiopsis ansamitocini]|uniref:histidine kinase n=2 Tax=Nocardiopsis ansamitocini TaxID=1670832 RepID=A0A9W6P6W5_9ACTN|nr:hypothetical protein Nans01_24990 [Nocardiopsis ansamitocini]
MVLIPSLGFLLLWAILTAASTLGALNLISSVRDGRAGMVAFGAIAADLRYERAQTQVYLGDLATETRADLDRGRERADATFARVHARTGALLDADRGELPRRVADFFTAWDELPDLRAAVDGGSLTREEALREYTALLDGILLVNDAIVVQLYGDSSRADGVTALELLRAHDRFSQAGALLSGALAAGEMNHDETAHFTFLSASYRDMLGAAQPNMTDRVRALDTQMRESSPWSAAEDLSLKVVSRSPVSDSTELGEAAFNSRIPTDATAWKQAVAGTDPLLRGLAQSQFQAALDVAWGSAMRVMVINAAGSLIALGVGAIGIVLALRSSRRLTGRLHRLHDETLEVADTRLPAIVAKAQRGARVDVAAELPPLMHGYDEIGRVADAFNTAQRTAVGSAVKQAEIREGANRVFLGIAYRNQALVQRQLQLLDEIESAEDDPETLRKLFQLDHLTTRSRRYADNLIILTGAHSTRRWREPMPVVDVLRAALSETEDFERVRLKSAPRAWVRGFAAADVVHLLAELVENATQFSPAGSRVDVNSSSIHNGLSIEVEDRGLGMTEAACDAANRTLARPPEFDVMALPDEPRLGLFVVARLAARHGVRVRLSPSPYGGTQACAVLPWALLADTPADALVPRQERSAPPRPLSEREPLP